MKKIFFLVFAMMFCIYSRINATPLSTFSTSDGWTQFAGDDGYRKSDGYVNPGWGGQSFDAEHLFYKFQNNILSIGLQTGFDLIDGNVYTGNINYYAGDLALSFDGNISNYEYAVDFGLFTRDYVGFNKVGGNTGTLGYDSAGLYKVNTWNNDVVGSFGASRPFAMQSGASLFKSIENLKGEGNSGYSDDITNAYGGYSYYRIVSFPIYYISEISGNIINLDAHWTMSCGNDAVNGNATIQRPVVPEPGTMFLIGSLATGLFGFAGLRKRFTK